MLASIGAFLAARLRRWIPDAFVFALLLTVGTALAAWLATPSSAPQVLDAWYRGFWLLLEFGMQIVLVLATGYAVALSPAAARGIDALASRVGRPEQVYLAVMVIGPLLTLVSWGWVVLTAVLARELAERVRGIDYPFLVACVFLSSWSWVCGLSSTIPLLLNTEDNFLITSGLLEGTIPTALTLGSRMNFVYLAVHAVLLPLVVMLARPRGEKTIALASISDSVSLPDSVAAEAERGRLAEPGALSDRLDHSRWLTGLIVLGGLAVLGRYGWTRGFDVNLEIMIFAFLILGIALHGTPMRYVVAMKRACLGISGIVFQYPFYAGIMGLMMFTGLGAAIAAWLASFASPQTLPAIAQFVGAVVNFAIPSAGGEWAVVGPGLIETANQLGAAAGAGSEQHRELLARVAMAVAYGETSTNLLQPFFLLIILPVMGAGARLQARDVMGHLVVPFVVSYVICLVVVTWVPL